MNRIKKYTFEILGITDDKHDIPLTISPLIKEAIGVEISTLQNNTDDAEQSAMTYAHDLIKEFDPDFKMDDTKKIRLRLKSVDFTWGFKEEE